MPDTDTNNPNQLLRSRYAIFEKKGVFGVVALSITPSINLVGRFDPRSTQQPNTYKAFETPTQAEHWFTEYAIASVSDNGWNIIYNGQRNYG